MLRPHLVAHADRSAVNVLAKWLILSQFRTRPWASGLSIMAIALGVALAYAVHLINDAAVSDLARAMKTLQGDADVIVAAYDSTDDVPLTSINEIARDPGVLVMAPVIEMRVRLDDTPVRWRLIGLDVFSAAAVMPRLLPRLDEHTQSSGGILADGVYVSPALLERLHLSIGAPIKLTRGDRTWRTTIAGDLPATSPDDEILVADIAQVQERFGPSTAVSEGRIRLLPTVDADVWRDAWASRLPSGVFLRAAGDDGARATTVSRAYRLNLDVLALVALLTSAFLVFAAQLTAVAQRSTQFALLGVLGWSPNRRLLQIFYEGLAVGLPGALLGLAIGYGLALAGTQVLGGDLGGGYFAGSRPAISFDLSTAFAFVALGCAASAAGACYPAVLNLRQPLAQALRAGFAYRLRPSADLVRRMQVPVLLAIAAGSLAQMPPAFELPLAAYVAIPFILGAGVTGVPLFAHIVFSRLAEFPCLAPAQHLALRQAAQAPLIAQVAASGLLVSFALTSSMLIMVSSFRLAVIEWLDIVVPAPLYVRSKGAPLPAALLEALSRPEAPFAKIEHSMYASLTIDPQRPSVALLIRELDPDALSERLPLIDKRAEVPVHAEVTKIWISEPLQEIYGWQPGQTRSLSLGGQRVEVFVSGVWRDYVRQFGAIVIAAADYRSLGGDFQATDLALWPRSTSDAGPWLADFVRDYGLDLNDSTQIRRLSLDIFDKSFAVTYALEAVAMLIGLFGLAVTVGASVGLRTRELATLGAIGFDSRMLGRALAFEGVLIAAIGLTLGLACGIAVGAVLTHVVNPQAFHWRMPLTLPLPTLFANAALTFAAAALASRFAARQAVRLPLAQVLARAAV